MMDGRTQDMRDLLGRIDTLVATLDDQKGDIIRAMEGIDRLAATLDRERTTIGAAIDAIGPAVKVLNQQHRALVTMLRELDKLGQVGTRVIRGSRANLVATLRHLEPSLRELADAGGSLPRGVGLMASFPFPKEAADLAKGDYANALFYMKFDLNKLFGSGAYGDSSNLPNPLEICMATPAAPVCDPLGKNLPKPGPAPSIPGLGDLGTLLGGLQSPGPATGRSSTTTSDPGLFGLLGGLLGGGS